MVGDGEKEDFLARGPRRQCLDERLDPPRGFLALRFVATVAGEVGQEVLVQDEVVLAGEREENAGRLRGGSLADAVGGAGDRARR